MFTASRNRAFAVLLAAATALLSAGERAQAQYPIRQRWLVALQQQNALQQQQNAVQAAVQQTTVLLQNAYQRVELPQPLAVTSLIDFQQQQSALQIALLQTSVLLQASYGRNPTLSETALREQNTLQTALQQTVGLQGALLAQNGQLTAIQLPGWLTLTNGYCYPFTFSAVTAILLVDVLQQKVTVTDPVRSTNVAPKGKAMPTSFPFSEATIRMLKPPTDQDREYHKDSKLPGLQLCVTSANSRTYYFVRRIDGKPTRVFLGKTDDLSVSQARAAAAQHAGAVASGRDPQADRRKRREEETLDAVWTRWLEVHAKPRKRSWKDDQRQYCKYLVPFHRRRISSIRPTDVAKWHVNIGRDHGRVQANRAKSLLATLLNYAIRLEMLLVNPCRSVPRFPEHSRERFLLPSEMKAFFDALAVVGEPWHDFFQLALFTGARRGNVVSMEWNELDLDRMVWSIPASKMKNKKPATVVLPPPAVMILNLRQDTRNGSAYVFPAKNTSGHILGPDKAWNRVRATSGLTDLKIHDLRRSFGSWQAIAGASLPIIGASLNHVNVRSTEVYARLQTNVVAESVGRATAAMMLAGGQGLLPGPAKGEDNEN